jgi:hypothetical protein
LPVVAVPTAVQTLDSEKVVVQPTAIEVNYLPDAQWADRLSRLLQARMVQAFENGRMRTVARAGERVNADYALATDVREFGLRITSESHAIVEISVKDRERAHGTHRGRPRLQRAGAGGLQKRTCGNGGARSGIQLRARRAGALDRDADLTSSPPHALLIRDGCVSNHSRLLLLTLWAVSKRSSPLRSRLCKAGRASPLLRLPSG